MNKTKKVDDLNFIVLRDALSNIGKINNSFDDIIENLQIKDKDDIFEVIKRIGECAKYLNKTLNKKFQIFQNVMHKTSHLNPQQIKKLFENVNDESYNIIVKEFKSLKDSCSNIKEIGNLNLDKLKTSLNVINKIIENLTLIIEILPDHKPNIQLNEKLECINIIEIIGAHINYLSELDKKKFFVFQVIRSEFSKFLNQTDKEEFLNQCNIFEQINTQLISIREKCTRSEEISYECNDLENIIKVSLDSYRKLKPLNYIIAILPESQKLKCLENLIQIEKYTENLESDLKSKIKIFEELQLSKLSENELKIFQDSINDADFKYIFRQLKDLSDYLMENKGNTIELDSLKVIKNILTFQERVDEFLPYYNKTNEIYLGNYDITHKKELLDMLSDDKILNDDRIINTLIKKFSNQGKNSGIFRKFENEIMNNIVDKLKKENENYNFNISDIRFILSIKYSILLKLKPKIDKKQEDMLTDENLYSLEKFDKYSEITLQNVYFNYFIDAINETSLDFQDDELKKIQIKDEDVIQSSFKFFVFRSIQLFNEYVECIQILENNFKDELPKDFLSMLNEIKNIDKNMCCDHYKYISNIDEFIKSSLLINNSNIFNILNLVKRGLEQLEGEKINFIHTQIKYKFYNFLNINDFVFYRRRELEMNQSIDSSRQKVKKLLKSNKNHSLSDKNYKDFLDIFFKAVNNEKLKILPYLQSAQYNKLRNFLLSKENFNINWNDSVSEPIEIFYHLVLNTNSESKNYKFERKIEIVENTIKLIENFQPISDNFELNFDIIVQQIIIKQIVEQKITQMNLYFERNKNETHDLLTLQLEKYLNFLESKSKEITSVFKREKLEKAKDEFYKKYVDLIEKFDFSSCTNTEINNLINELKRFFDKTKYQSYWSLQELLIKRNLLNKILDNKSIYLNDDLNNVLIKEFDSKEKFKIRAAIIFISGCVLEQNKHNQNILEQHYDAKNMKIKIVNLFKNCKDLRDKIFHTDPVKESNKLENPEQIRDEFLKLVNILINLNGLLKSLILEWKSQITNF